jgi:hypothetical protein
MTSVRRNLIRTEQTRGGIDTLADSIRDWLCRRRAHEFARHHMTQLDVIDSVLTGALGEIRRCVCEVDPTWSTGEVYERCRDCDQAVVWLQRVWEYYSPPFDQRDEPQRLGPLLRAADEVVWSCYRQVLNGARSQGCSIPHGPSPLAYIEPEHSPAAVGAGQRLPFALRLNVEVDGLESFLTSIPVPVLRLPPWCVDAPWWLVFVGHEIGHYAQNDLTLVKHFREGIEGALLAHGVSAGRAESWGMWGEEIFADTFSLLVMGQWALWALAEIETSTPKEMVKLRPTYPAAVVRLALMAQVAERLGIDAASALRGVDLAAVADSDARAKRDMESVYAVADFALGPLPGNLGTLPELLRFSAKTFAPGREVANWAQLLRRTGPIARECRLETGRQLASASLCAWVAITEDENGGRRQAKQTTLAERVKETLIANAPSGVRAGSATDGNMPEKGAQLGAHLLGAARARRERPPSP